MHCCERYGISGLDQNNDCRCSSAHADQTYNPDNMVRIGLLLAAAAGRQHPDTIPEWYEPVVSS